MPHESKSLSVGRRPGPCSWRIGRWTACTRLDAESVPSVFESASRYLTDARRSVFGSKHNGAIDSVRSGPRRNRSGLRMPKSVSGTASSLPGLDAEKSQCAGHEARNAIDDESLGTEGVLLVASARNRMSPHRTNLGSLLAASPKLLDSQALFGGFSRRSVASALTSAFATSSIHYPWISMHTRSVGLRPPDWLRLLQRVRG